jgi:hypothetical protein
MVVPYKLFFYQCWDGKLSGESVTVLCVLECGDGLTAVKIYIFVFRRAAQMWIKFDSNLKKGWIVSQNVD